MAYEKARNSYYVQLNTNKKSTLRAKIQECEGDSKQLHKLVNNLPTKCIDNPLPPSKSDTELTDSFASFFNKILTIRMQFQDIPQYQSEVMDVPKLHKFNPMTEKQVELIVKDMKTKSCESDPIPTHIFRQMLPAILLVITRIVNL